MLSSLDGRFAGPGPDPSHLAMDAAFDAHNLELLEAADVLISGRSTFEGHLQTWPPIHAGPEGLAGQLGVSEDRADVMRGIAARSQEMDKIVISDTFVLADCGPWSASTTIVPRADAVDLVRSLRRNGWDLVTFGSATTWNPLLSAGVVDELRVLLSPTIVGTGPATFTSAVETGQLALVDQPRALGGSETVRIRYRVASASN